ncbi:MAG: ABC transporter permease subunit [Kiritimatiellae bacterium]|jgi:peptide/nickel transport system permease protein|nr:ABC transporter permease subunit [Kiritimatiellia bacterium]
MFKYVIKRILSTIPIIFGVILLTFILFDLVSGSPAQIVLGKNAKIEDLERYDELNGYNKPVVFGLWSDSRILQDSSFKSSMRPFVENDGIEHVFGTVDGYVVISDGSYPVPMALEFYPKEKYKFIITYKTIGDGGVKVSMFQKNGTASPTELVLKSTSGKYKTVTIPFKVGDFTGSDSISLNVTGGQLQIQSLKLRRKILQPFNSRFLQYVVNVLTLDFGTSVVSKQKVTDVILEGVGPSLCLAIPIFFGTLFVSVCLALVCAWYRDRLPDRLLVILSTSLMSINYIVWVIAGQYLLAYKLKLFPIWGFNSWYYFVLPVIIGIVCSMGRDIRFYRTIMLDEMYMDYVRTARAKGLPGYMILFKHVLRNALVPILTNVSISIPFLFTGSLLLETYFGIPGLGNASINAINSADIFVVQGIVLVGAMLYVVVNLVTDVMYTVVDPRIRLK